jgi:hypothetical protein
MYRSAPYHRRESRTNHPPYGLYLDAHGGQHNWILVSTRLLMVLSFVMAVLVLFVAFGPWPAL